MAKTKEIFPLAQGIFAIVLPYQNLRAYAAQSSHSPDSSLC